MLRLRCFLLSLLVVTTVSAADLLGIPSDFTEDDDVLSAVSHDVARKFEKEYISYLKTGVESPVLRQMSARLASLNNGKDLFTKDASELSSGTQFVVCTSCRATVRVLAGLFREEDGELNGPNSEEYAKYITLDFCKRFAIQTEEVCAGLFDSNWPHVEYIIKETDIDSESFCSLFLGYGLCKSYKNPNYNWTLVLDTNRPEITAPKSDIPKKSDDDLKILHLTDLHYDPLYEAGSLAVCEEPVCCQRHKETIDDESKAAGYWGDYRDCDTPWQTIENALDHIRSTHKQIDYIYHTGDIVDHMSWATSIEKNEEVITKVNNKVAEVFPGIPVYSCIGNHESHPSNIFSPGNVPDNISMAWMYEHLYKDWSDWLPAEAKETVLKGGYYTVSPKAGFRIIALNNIYDCYSDNWWLYYNGTNKMDQLEWLQDTLLAAEKADEYVHILTHVPSADGKCWSVWAREYNRIIERFSDTISGIFNGHTHKDEMHVHYSENGYAIAMSWNGGSLTPYTDNNPNYRIYEVEPKSFQVVDHETWIFNLTEANEIGESESPRWFKEYVFSEVFTDDLSPAGIDQLLEDMANDPDLLLQFWKYKMTNADPRMKKGCARNCLLSTICRLATTVNNQKDRCEELQRKLTITLDNDTTTSTSTPPSGTTPGDDGTTKDPGDGAAAISAFQMTSFIAFILLVKLFI